MSTEISQFKHSNESNNNLANKPPQCILDLPLETPGRQPLTDKQWTDAKADCIHKDITSLDYPKTTKLHRDPPIPGQYIGLFSFIPSKNARPDTDGCFGVLKLRGNFPDEPKADTHAEMIVRQHDSYAFIDHTWVGMPFPLMVDNSKYRSITREIDIRRKTTEVLTDELKNKREAEKRDMEEVQKRHAALLADVNSTKDDHPEYDDLEQYTQLRVKYANIKYRQDDLEKRIAEGKVLLKNIQQEVSKMDREHPEYKEQAMAKYKQALESSGIDQGANPLIKYMME